MRIFEIASAEEQMALWKLITTNVWTAIDQQVQQQARERAAKAKRPSAKGKTARARVAAPVALPITAPPPPSAATANTATAKQQQPAQDATAAVGSVGTAVQPVGGFTKRTEKDKAEVADDDADAVQPMRKKLR